MLINKNGSLMPVTNTSKGHRTYRIARADNNEVFV